MQKDLLLIAIANSLEICRHFQDIFSMSSFQSRSKKITFLLISNKLRKCYEVPYDYSSFGKIQVNSVFREYCIGLQL